MQININDRFILTNDKFNWILQERIHTDPNHKWSKGGREKIVVIGYFGKLEHLVNRLIFEEIKGSNSNTLEELLEAIYQLNDTVKTCAGDIERRLELKGMNV